MEHFQYGKQIGKTMDITNKQQRHRAPKHILLGLKSGKSGNQVPYLDFLFKYLEFVEKSRKLAHEISVRNGSYTFPNELTRFRLEAKPIWGKIKTHCEHAVIILMWL